MAVDLVAAGAAAVAVVAAVAEIEAAVALEVLTTARGDHQLGMAEEDLLGSGCSTDSLEADEEE